MGDAVAKLSITHQQIMNWLIINPHLSMRQCADHFQISQAWLSRLVHSDLFQAELALKTQRVASMVEASIPERLHAVASIALDKLADKVEKSEDPDFILDAADKALHRLGYAPSAGRPSGSGHPAPGAVHQNNFFIGAGDLADAREIMRQSSKMVEGVEVLPAPEDTNDGGS